MTTLNAMQKKIIKALATAPAAALRELLKNSDDPAEREYIKRLAVVLNIKI